MSRISTIAELWSMGATELAGRISTKWASAREVVEAHLRRTMGTRAPESIGAHARDVYVQESGRPGSPAVVFIHGGGPGGRMWHAHLDRLAGRFHCLAPDLPGFGRSNYLAPLSLPETADLVAELIGTHVPARRAHVVGLSYGGSVVFSMLERHPDCVDRAVIDGASVLPVWGGWGDRLVQLGTKAISPVIDTRPVAGLLSLVGLRGLGIELRSASPRAFRRAYEEGFTAPASRAALEAPCPTLLVAGEKEVTVRASNAALAALMPDATARFVPGLGHAWFAWRRELHVRMVEAWLTGEALPEELEAELPSPAAADRVRHQLKTDRPGVPPGDQVWEREQEMARRHVGLQERVGASTPLEPSTRR